MVIDRWHRYKKMNRKMNNCRFQVDMIENLTKSTYFPFVQAHRGYYAVVNVRVTNCGPCNKAYPMFEELAAKYADDPRFQFAAFYASKEDADFVINTLKTSAVPEFNVYHKNDRIFTVTSPSRFNELEAFLEQLP